MVSHLDATAVHESAHAAISHLLGVDFDYVTIYTDRRGEMMPFHSPCPICGNPVDPGITCPSCLFHFEENDPSQDERALKLWRYYREDGAVASAGEIAEDILTNGAPVCDLEEVESDRDRLQSRASLAHLPSSSRKLCRNYYGKNRDCSTCEEIQNDVRQRVRHALDSEATWRAIGALAERLKLEQRLTGAKARTLLEENGLTFGSVGIDDLFPVPPYTHLA